jgi:hypothetical protein
MHCSDFNDKTREMVLQTVLVMNIVSSLPTHLGHPYIQASNVLEEPQVLRELEVERQETALHRHSLLLAQTRCSLLSHFF